jgi:GWxTD domain-containing protein
MASGGSWRRGETFSLDSPRGEGYFNGRGVAVVIQDAAPAISWARPKRLRKTASWLILVLLAAAPGCRLYHLEQRLTPPYADFYAKVQYIMTPEERKIFLELPDSEKDGFIADFWERRNPNPDSGRNAFKIEYEERVARAEALFHGEGRPGYLTDRGRIYILFGPPSERLTYPMDASGYCREVWYYGAFPVIFVDEHCQGQFVLTAVNLEHLEALNIAQGHFQKTFEQDKRFFDYRVSLVKTRSEPALVEGRIVVDVPYAGIWFTFADGRLTTEIDARAEVRDGDRRLVWEGRTSSALDLSEDELKERRSRDLRLEIPFLLDQDVAALRARKLTLLVSVMNQAGDEGLKKALEFRLKP